MGARGGLPGARVADVPAVVLVLEDAMDLRPPIRRADAADWLIAWVDWLLACLINWLVAWLAGGLIDGLMDGLIA